MWHQPCQRCKYTKTRYKKLVTLNVEPHVSAVSLFKRAENSAIINQSFGELNVHDHSHMLIQPNACFFGEPNVHDYSHMLVQPNVCFFGRLMILAACWYDQP